MALAINQPQQPQQKRYTVETPIFPPKNSPKVVRISRQNEGEGLHSLFNEIRYDLTLNCLADLAESLDGEVGYSTLYNWRIGKVKNLPTTKRLVAVAEALGFKIYWSR